MGWQALVVRPETVFNALLIAGSEYRSIRISVNALTQTRCESVVIIAYTPDVRLAEEAGRSSTD